MKSLLTKSAVFQAFIVLRNDGFTVMQFQHEILKRLSERALPDILVIDHKAVKLYMLKILTNNEKLTPIQIPMYHIINKSLSDDAYYFIADEDNYKIILEGIKTHNYDLLKTFKPGIEEKKDDFSVEDKLKEMEELYNKINTFTDHIKSADKKIIDINTDIAEYSSSHKLSIIVDETDSDIAFNNNYVETKNKEIQELIDMQRKYNDDITVMVKSIEIINNELTARNEFSFTAGIINNKLSKYNEIDSESEKAITTALFHNSYIELKDKEIEDMKDTIIKADEVITDLQKQIKDKDFQISQLTNLINSIPESKLIENPFLTDEYKSDLQTYNKEYRVKCLLQVIKMYTDNLTDEQLTGLFESIELLLIGGIKKLKDGPTEQIKKDRKKVFDNIAGKPSKVNTTVKKVKKNKKGLKK